MSHELFEKVLKYKKVLDKIFYDNKFFAKGYTKFLKVCHQLEIPNNIIKFYYDNQAIVQVFRPDREFHDTNHYPILSNYPFERVYIDTMYLSQNNSTLAFCNIMDLYSKYAYSHVFVIGGNNIKSSQSKQTFKEFLEIIKKFNYKIESVVSDLGSEYQGEFQQYLKELGIKQYTADSGNKKITSPIERFNGTLRNALEKYKYLFHKLDNKELENILYSYNNTHHSSIDNTPENILKNKIDLSNINKEKINNYHRVKPIEGYVRILINKGIFKKMGQNWSNEIYKIEKFIPLKNRYLLDNGVTYPLEDLQLVQKEYIMKPDLIIEKKKSNKKYIIPEKEEVMTRSKSRFV
jgi:transposase InsO family protein